MKQEIVLDDKNVLAMKLLHYFITEKNYNPIILQGVENEIWLENLNEDCKVVRIVSSYIHNDEQFDFDTFKTKRIISKIKKKTLSLNMNVLSIFLDLGENVSTDKVINTNNLMYVNLSDEATLKDNALLNKVFPDLDKKMQYEEKGEALFIKITKDINLHNQKDAMQVEEVFRIKFPLVTYILIAINVIIFLGSILLNKFDVLISIASTNGSLIRAGEYYRLFTGMFLHADIIHLACNMYALYVLGTQMESYLGKVKYLIIYLLSGLAGSLFSMMFYNGSAVGASGAIFGLLGSLLYFGYHYRVFLGNVIRSQIIPLIVVNLLIGFMVPGIGVAAHIGGLVGGALVTMALGIDNKSSTSEKVNGFIISLIFFAFITYMAFIYIA